MLWVTTNGRRVHQKKIYLEETLIRLEQTCKGVFTYSELQGYVGRKQERDDVHNPADSSASTKKNQKLNHCVDLG